MIYLELLRNDDGAIVDIVPITDGLVGPVLQGGFAQIIDGEIVATFKDEEILVLPTDNDRDAVKQKAPPTAPIPAGLMMVESWEDALKGGAGGGYLGMKYIDGEWDLNFWPVLANPEIWLLPMIGRPK